MKSYFWKDATGVNADLARHNIEQKEIEQKISTLEAKVMADPADKFAVSCLRTYREFLNKLMDSKVNVVAKIGRKNLR